MIIQDPMRILLRLEIPNQRDLVDLHVEIKSTVQMMSGAFSVLSGDESYRVFQIDISSTNEPTLLKNIRRIVAPLNLECTTAFVPDYMIRIVTKQ